jgi:phage baseplate assembly protein W
MTVKGERPFQPEFGADIYSYIFEPIEQEALATNLEESIRNAISI